MRIGEDHIRQELEKTLDALEIRGASKEKLMEYLDPDKPGDESLLEGLEQVDLAGGRTSRGAGCPSGPAGCHCWLSWRR